MLSAKFTSNSSSIFFNISKINNGLLFREKNIKVASGYNDGIEEIDPDTIVLSDSGVRISFSDVILSKPKETRKLVVFEQDGTVSYTIEDRMIDSWDWEQLKKYQTVKYEGTGSFVVDLDELSQYNIVEDKANKDRKSVV